MNRIKNPSLWIIPSIGTGLVVSLMLHEIGHWLATLYFGIPSSIIITLTDSYVIHATAPQDALPIIQFAGGSLSAGIFSMLFLIKQLRDHVYARPLLFVGIIGQGISAIMEGGLNWLYNDTALTIIPLVAVACTIINEYRIIRRDQQANK